jgi:hypothetical protein
MFWTESKLDKIIFCVQCFNLISGLKYPVGGYCSSSTKSVVGKDFGQQNDICLI